MNGTSKRFVELMYSIVATKTQVFLISLEAQEQRS